MVYSFLCYYIIIIVVVRISQLDWYWVLHLLRLPALATRVAMQRHRQSTTTTLDYEERRILARHMYHDLTATLTVRESRGACKKWNA